MEHKREDLILTKKGPKDSRIITIRIRETLLADLDRLADESNYSRNELISIILTYGVNNIEIR